MWEEPSAEKEVLMVVICDPFTTNDPRLIAKRAVLMVVICNLFTTMVLFSMRLDMV